MSESDSQGFSGVHQIRDEKDDHVIDEVCLALEERLDSNLGTTVYCQAGQLRRNHDLPFPGQKVSAALRELAGIDGRVRGLTVERINPDANRPRWKVQRFKGQECEIRTDGGQVIDGPGFQQAIRIVLEDAKPGGLSRTVLLERAAEIARTTQADVENGLEELRKRGEVYDINGEFQLTPDRQFELDWGGGFS